MSLIGNIEDFPDNSTHGMHSAGLALLIVRRAGELYIYENNCPHTRETLDPEGGSLAVSGGLLIQCQRHSAEFIAETGECVAGPCQGEALTAIPFTLSGSDIYLD
ncbi:Biphenyl dioxygenase system ferredoxin subunit [Halioglobus japonicus]|nr:Biphenyl dioxygenase system ferredoxin subunit [Halioglobus japonicus]